jgi:hypothetical protein
MIDSARDDAVDGTLDMAVDMAGNATLDDATDMAGDGILEAATDTASHRGADIEMEGDQDEWGRSMAIKNLVSHV